MSAPGSGFYGAIAMKANPSPCKPDCPRRSAVCHCAGNCPEYEAWKAGYVETLKAVKRKYDGERGVNNMIALKRLRPQYRTSVVYHRKLEKLK